MLVLDVETTGTNPQVHSILSIGALDLKDPSNQFYGECRAWEGAKLEKEAAQINGIGEEAAIDPSKQTEAELVAAFITWAQTLDERTFAAQNVSFDHSFVEAAAHRAGLEFPFAKRTIDLHTLAWLHMTERGAVAPMEKHHSALNSKAVLAYCGLPEEPRPHNALSGAKWHAEVVSRIAYNQSIFPEFSNFPLPWQTK